MTLFDKFPKISAFTSPLNYTKYSFFIIHHLKTKNPLFYAGELPSKIFAFDSSHYWGPGELTTPIPAPTKCSFCRIEA